jgi:hypothetical protein
MPTELKWIFGIVVLAFVVWWLVPDDWRIKYAAEYMLDTDRIVIEHKPFNCDWDSAPIGSKHCHYEKLVTVYNQDDKIIEGPAQANPLPDDQKSAKVHVGWQRVED